jgi:hypothetical protein
VVLKVVCRGILASQNAVWQGNMIVIVDFIENFFLFEILWKRTDNIETTVKRLETTIQCIEAQGFQEPSYNMIFYKEKLLDPLLRV